MLLDDNAMSQIGKVVKQYIQHERNEIMNWSASSSDMNHIKHAFDMLQTKLSSLPKQPNSLAKLEQANLEGWTNTPGLECANSESIKTQ